MKKLFALVGILMLLLLITTQTSYGQRTVTGKVLDAAGEALIGATVISKGTTTGTITDFDGSFELTIPDDNPYLEVSYTGYGSMEIDMTGQTSYMVTMREDAELLSEVVVIGYGRQKKSVVTGAVGKVDIADIQTRAPGQLQSSIQGRVAGIAITPNSGAPDAGFKVKIRGTGSNGPNEPLYIVDGMRTRNINFIEPANIQSLEILKDAASASIYGAEGANGVVLISTKDGSDNNGASYSMQIGQQSYRGNMELLNATQWQDYLVSAGVEGADTLNTNTSTNWLDELFQTAPTMRHSLAFDGSSDNVSYHLGANYFDQAGIIGGADKSRFKRLSANIGLKVQATDWLEAGTNLTIANNQSRGAGNFGDVNVGGIISSAILMDPSTPVTYNANNAPAWVNGLDQSLLTRDENGNIYGLSQTTNGEVINPNVYLNLVNGDGSRVNTLFGSVYGAVSITDALTFTSRFGFDNATGTFHNWTPAYFANPTRQSSSANSAYSFFSGQSQQWENYLNYDVALGGNIELGLLAGTSIYNSEGSNLNGNASGLITSSAQSSYLDGTEASSEVLGSNSRQRLQSFFGRANFNVSDKYLVMASLRRDGTSLLAEANRWKTYPGISVGWVLSREDFFNGDGVINFAKLRASWGQAGSLATIGQSSGRELLQAQFSYAGQTVIDPIGLSNNSLTWETSEQLNVGVDLGAADDRLTLSVDYFNKLTRDLLTPSSPPGFIGNTGPLVNAGTMKNTGIEFELGYNNRDNKLKYQVNLNFTTLKNEVTELNETDFLQGSQLVGTSWNPSGFEVGQPAWYFRGYKTDGLNDDGTPNIIDTDGNGEISPDDYDFIGSPHPSLLYGGAINLEYGKLDFTLFLQGQSGNDILMGFNRTDRANGNKPSIFAENDFFAPNVDGNGYFSDFMIFDGSFTRVKQIQLGYDLGDVVGDALSALRVYVSLEDYFTFTKYPGLDPEIGSNFNDAIGIDRGTYPIPGRLMFGLTTNF